MFLGLVGCVKLKKQAEIDTSVILSEKERIDRIAIDFTANKEDVVSYISRYIGVVTDSMLEVWERNKALEYAVIDGEKRYFHNAAPNLFRIDSLCRAIKNKKEPPLLSGSEKVNASHVPAVINILSGQSGNRQACPVRMKVTYRITIPANTVPEGETIRCWLPYPREDSRRQKNVEFISANNPDYIIAPAKTLHRTIYMETKAQKDSAAIFSVVFAYTSVAEWFNLSENDIAPYNTDSDLYKTFTSERSTHVIFTDSIKSLSRKIVGDEKSPLQKIRKIFEYIDSHYPWASAREYSTVQNIPQYVIENKHGDCGMVSLLFITLARYNGIPAKWQSGFMMHPGAQNLHDWAEVYFEGIGWVPVDQSFGSPSFSTDDKTRLFFSNGIDAYRLIVNDDFSAPLYPPKKYPRSETVDFQRGEVEWSGGNLYFDKWNWSFSVEYIN